MKDDVYINIDHICGFYAYTRDVDGVTKKCAALIVSNGGYKFTEHDFDEVANLLAGRPSKLKLEA